jgi:beta-galactosidase
MKMKTTTFWPSIFASILLTTIIVSCSKATSRETTKFTKEWKFILGDSEAFKNPDFNDSGWRKLNLPHDWSIEGEFNKDNPASPGGGALPGGTGWYRKSFNLPTTDKGKQIFIDFDGVYQNSDVWINGQHLGFRPYGYISFRYDLTPYLKFGNEENIIAVKVNNSEQPNSRWYSGSGIFRNVWLVKTGNVFVDHWGTYITTPVVSEKFAKTILKIKVKNTLGKQAGLKIKTTFFDPDGKEVLKSETTKTPWDKVEEEFTQENAIQNPKLWSLETPALYKAVTEVYASGKLTDRYETSFGIRSFEFDPLKGFSLNGKHVKILGVCQHHDLGCLGSAINTRALERQLEILKEMGCNSIRTSHNPPAPELLDLCDRMGFIVQDETFDMWRKKKTQYDYSRYFPEWHERDLADHILRDRNHPSVMMWSIGNEVLEQWEQVDADTLNIQEANLILNFEKNINKDVINSGQMSINSLLTSKLANIVKNLDPTRPVTAACNDVNPYNNLFKSGSLDVYGFNYHQQSFIKFNETYPGKSFIVSESTSGLMTRGFYQMPSDTVFIWPHQGRNSKIPFGNPEQQCSAYDNCRVPWGSTHEETWKIVKKYDHISGFYIWTGFDYLGEPTPYWWPSRSSYFGIIDLAGFPKDVYYMYQSEWTKKDVLHIFPHWNWKPGQTVDVWAYSNAQEVELFLNGKSLGTKTKQGDDLHLMWRIPFEPGTLKAVSRTNGKVVLQQQIKTAGEPAQIRLTADHGTIRADGDDLSFVTVDILDKDGNMVPDAGNPVKFKVSGNAKIVGVDNGNPISLESMKGSGIKAFNGKCLVVVQSGETPGDIQLTASADGLKSQSINIKLK